MVLKPLKIRPPGTFFLHRTIFPCQRTLSTKQYTGDVLTLVMVLWVNFDPRVAKHVIIFQSVEPPKHYWKNVQDFFMSPLYILQDPTNRRRAYHKFWVFGFSVKNIGRNYLTLFSRVFSISSIHSTLWFFFHHSRHRYEGETSLGTAHLMTYIKWNDGDTWYWSRYKPPA